jgi:hypothetical protein
MFQVVETCRLGDGFIVKRLRHLKCNACGSRFFDDEAMNVIQIARASCKLSGAKTEIRPSKAKARHAM